jgi:hypothetical protein
MSGALRGSNPITKLQAARLGRRLTLKRVVVAAELALQALDEQPPTRASLKAQISAFENGRRKPGPTYRAVFREIYRATDEELGLHQSGLTRSVPSSQRLSTRLTAASTPASSTISTMCWPNILGPSL